MMLERLFSSKTRVGILRLLFSNPDERYYVRQIARELGRDISGIKRELDNLDKAGLLASEKIGNLRYYTVNKSCRHLRRNQIHHREDRRCPGSDRGIADRSLWVAPSVDVFHEFASARRGVGSGPGAHRRPCGP